LESATNKNLGNGALLEVERVRDTAQGAETGWGYNIWEKKTTPENHVRTKERMVNAVWHPGIETPSKAIYAIGTKGTG